MNVLLLVSSFNGLSQRVWCALRETGHRVSIELAGDHGTMIEIVSRRRPDLILCPFLKERVPEEIWSTTRTVNLHPGPIGDKGPSSLDYAISQAAPRWGVTALQLVERMDAGPIWTARTFDLPLAAKDLVRKSAIYNSLVADAAVDCALEVVQKAMDPTFRPTPPVEAIPNVPGARTLPPMRQSDRAFPWEQSTDEILRRVHAADGSPGVLTTLAGIECFAYDAHPGPSIELPPGRVGKVRHEAVLVGTGDGSVWIGHLRARSTPGAPPMIKLPARGVLREAIAGIPEIPDGLLEPSEDYRPIVYRRDGNVGTLSFDFYNGAMSTAQCLRLEAALRQACEQDTTVLVLRGRRPGEPFSNGIHLNVIEAAPDPANEAWWNIRAINAVCMRIADCPRQVIVAAYTGNAGAGGVMMALGADVVVARDGVILNPYYDIGLYGSELHTRTLPLRAGEQAATRLLEEKLPISVNEAHSLGLVDLVGPRADAAFDDWLEQQAKHYATEDVWTATMERKRRRMANTRPPLDVYEVQELAQMSRDMFEDRKGFQAARRAFVRKSKSAGTPERLTGWR